MRIQKDVPLCCSEIGRSVQLEYVDIDYVLDFFSVEEGGFHKWQNGRISNSKVVVDLRIFIWFDFQQPPSTGPYELSERVECVSATT